MASPTDDRWLWLGLGIFFFAAFKGIQYAMRDLRDLTRLDPAQYPSEEDDNTEPEDSIRVQTLKTLTAHYNPDIANAAISIVVSRFMRDKDAVADLNKDCSSEDADVCRKARQVVDFLSERGIYVPFFPSDGDSIPGPYRGFAPSEAPLDELPHRGYGPSGVPDGMFLNVRHDIERLSQLRADMNSRGASASFAGRDVIPSQRPPASDSPAEVERRRRRREAMVLHEGARRVTERDIYHPSGMMQGDSQS